ncbi:nitroreductase family deazaflavin-dependent oxidoreductase [Actinoplanes sp. TRM 88003]|uniref:Nitroreductase family deazaflavin-dependent oxidoreductase n=1 Tax=Paractinoplanes aksuensis TaxID=2939490 RepID=A0ABT1DPE7_9ACTN|nr:nitroreductase/quinone reductase family protein [Actinoplanes aksuensis]MCO8272694.1 nitroreductase family deazaflavin-dependent oxidoreductase [Actinoplanes aksuensis]
MSNSIDPMIEEFRRTGGTVPRFGRNLVLMHGVGARSGRPRTNAARGIRFRVGWVVAATAGGQSFDPAWAHNLRAHPDITLEVPRPGSGIETLPVRTTELAEPDRSAAWQLFLAASPNFARFEMITDRVFPIFYFTRREQDEHWVGTPGADPVPGCR